MAISSSATNCILFLIRYRLDRPVNSFPQANKKGCFTREAALSYYRCSISYRALSLDVVVVREVTDEHFFPALQATHGSNRGIRHTQVVLGVVEGTFNHYA